ncbi:peptidoglycan-binding protein [Pseudooceanicola sediminis]|uniref:Peptidoglycan-binding protein n=1 Tax=Pseudooceanicola sediminis TaxID=2211117 RepID=A0A399IXR4_9RHOB|nr:serine protease [Pseudooceanicola sediminis]KAA2313105.1 peptidoglycan-binding protein [Puniceibacterium sp. HSS470]RII37754.1 peptidoglycan-binding protein [Pseudooceanicola sediminis]|tara:strand:- start:42245 stop:44035 length:1791 start_codon:yes stop_codon:yes gene_type:complete
MIRILVALVCALSFGVQGAFAQGAPTNPVYVQIEAQPSLEEAQQSIRIYTGSLQDVNGFSLGNGYYAIALGPYAPDQANQVLNVLRSEGRIPQDSYIARPEWFAGQFWPVGGTRPTQAPDSAAPQDGQSDVAAAPEIAPDAAPEAAPETAPDMGGLPDESPAEARRSEAQLSREQRDQLQIALEWAGYYNGAIDGAFGPGTRNSMGAWQRDNGYDISGILTTAQRADLLEQYNAVLSDLGLRDVRDEKAGIAMQMPTDLVAFDRYEAPFAFYEPTGSTQARVILISEPGTQDTLGGLYQIMQTLAVVPQDGPRSRRGNSFTIQGSNSQFTSYTEASLEGGQIKGFTLVWPLGDEARRERMLAEMRASFTRLAGVLPRDAGVDDSQAVDLLSGLKIRKPRLSRSGVFVTDDGVVLTVAEAVQSCGRVTLANGYDAEVVGVNDTTGLAVLRPKTPLTPIGVAAFSTRVPQISAEVAVAGFSYEGVLGAPSLTYGTLADVRGLNGAEHIDRLDINTLPGDAGGAVFDETGAVIGILRPATEQGRQLPEGVGFSVDAASVMDLLRTAGLKALTSTETGQMAPETLARKANGMTVLVNCWD